MYGISKLSIIPGRAEPSDKAEIVTQILFGEHYEVLEDEATWLLVRLAYDGYKCWIDRKQHHPLSADEFAELQKFKAPRTIDMLGLAKDPVQDTYYNLPMGSRLPFFHDGSFRIGESDFTFKGTQADPDPKNLLSYAGNYINSPYLWGGRTPFGIDCSGFTQMVFALINVPLPRDASQQVSFGTDIAFGDHQAGDLAFFLNSKGAISHVGLITNPQQIIHASGLVRMDQFTSEGIWVAAERKLSHHLASIKRVMPETNF